MRKWIERMFFPKYPSIIILPVAPIMGAIMVLLTFTLLTVSAFFAGRCAVMYEVTTGVKVSLEAVEVLKKAADEGILADRRHDADIAHFGYILTHHLPDYHSNRKYWDDLMKERPGGLRQSY